jgi:hypothetical protein
MAGPATGLATRAVMMTGPTAGPARTAIEPGPGPSTRLTSWNLPFSAHPPQARKREREAEAALLRAGGGGGAGEDHEWLPTARGPDFRAAGPAPSARSPAGGGFPMGRSLSTGAVDESGGAGRARGTAGEEAASMPLLIAKMQARRLGLWMTRMGR